MSREHMSGGKLGTLSQQQQSAVDLDSNPRSDSHVRRHRSLSGGLWGTENMQIKAHDLPGEKEGTRSDDLPG
jgi:hypothetical protein